VLYIVFNKNINITNGGIEKLKQEQRFAATPGEYVLTTSFSDSLKNNFLPPTFFVVFQGERCEE
jgi:hypothetical protein